VLDIKGFRIPQGYYLHSGHTWIKVEESSTVRVGIDEFAQRLLGPFDRIEAPLLGKEVKQGKVLDGSQK
jgi:glycine cleavage system H lipoate-binding protein